MPGKPAARLLDPAAHGGMIMFGFPMVLIEGMPAARQLDPIICPAFNGPVPHVGGVITMGSTSVMIGGQPAARMGDPVACAGPPGTIIKGATNTLIGDGGSGGAGGGGGGGNSKKVAAPEGKGGGSDIGSGSGGDGDTSAEEEGHYLKVAFVDKAGLPIVGMGYALTTPSNETEIGLLTGEVKRPHVDPGSYKFDLKAIINAKWSKNSAKVGEKVKMTAETAGIDSGEKATLEVVVRDGNFSHRVIKTIETQVQGDKFEDEWELLVDDEYLKLQDEKLKAGGFSTPTFYFVAKTAGIELRSRILECKDDIEISLKTEEGKPIANRKYKLFLPSGEIRQGKLNGSGYAKESDVPPGRVKVAFELKSREQA